MDSNKYREFLLSTIPTAKSASGGKMVNCRCFYCPDGKSAQSKHFYISIPQDDKTPSLYYCHKCHSSGVVTYRTLLEWGIYDENVAGDLIDHNKNCSKYNNNTKYYNRITYRLNNTITTDNDNTRAKLMMINNRLGTRMSYSELRNLKIVLNLKDLLYDNHITNLTRDPKIVDQLDNNFMGFLSIDNAFLNMRRLCDEGLVYQSIDKRYINYNIFNKFDTSERFYTIPTEINLSKPERVKIHIAEGPFDILSIYKNLRNQEEGIYTSIAGSNYQGIALYFLSMFKIPYVEFHFYPDNDQYGSNNVMRKIINLLAPINPVIYIHRNEYPNEKDFGVSPNRIKEVIYKAEDLYI